jgi:hypothetical protein
MEEALMALGFALGLLISIMVFATHMSLLGDFKYYKPIYKSFKRGDYKYLKLGNFLYFKKGHDEMVFFPDGAIQLTTGVYIHQSFIHWFTPYSIYYKRKFNKVKDKLIAQNAMDELYERESNILWRSLNAESETPVVKEIKPFKLLRG